MYVGRQGSNNFPYISCNTKKLKSYLHSFGSIDRCRMFGDSYTRDFEHQDTLALYAATSKEKMYR